MVNYKDLGLVNTREMFKKAINGGYAIPAFNFNNMEQLQAIIKASSELKGVEGCSQLCQPDSPALYGTGCCGVCKGTEMQSS